MSLTEPNIFERAIGKIQAQTPHTRIIVYLFVGIVLLGAVLFTFDRCSSYRADREANKIKSNANAIVAKIKTLENKAVVDETQVAIEKDRLRQELINLEAAQAASEEDRLATNAAIQELEAAKAADYRGTSAAELKAILDQLERP